ncbi:outer membrane protein assembly factor BamA [Pleionea litopenaei]|uniref:Outer membrane protein assembly factor BamA n=1 Tax=Pleionea litopenaei TaxID=3070815 RepID=A0AA51X6L8_9GAMM|nr:outer membrane protein assembly factor BamA [Pleionea sp. HL-JVS1]WMS86966.1 outer membrane protein assembly factor BamA [Pleionea sp. HL-JVS1]
MTIKQIIIQSVLAVVCTGVFANFETFKVQDIKVNGLQRIDIGTFFTYLPIQVGENLDEARLPNVIRSLNRTGSFQYIKVSREGNTLVFDVEERPIIADIVIEGNKELKTEDLLNGMRSAGFAKGEVYQAAALEAIASEIENQYFSHGKYGVKIKTRALNMSRNRVQVRMDVDEGEPATIREINIVGNSIFSDEDLLDQFELSTGGMFSFFTSDDQYAREKLSGDIEKLRNYYLDRGYLKFQITSTQVAISPDRKGMFITINVDEGEKFTVSDIKFSGELVYTEEQLRALVPLQKGDTYSGAAISFAEERIAEFLGYQGYAFANVMSAPDIDEEKKEVVLTIFVDPKKKTYVRRISFSGNESTNDHVFRREARLMEGEALSTQLVERSKVRMERLPFVESVTVETPKVDGTDDQVDVEFKVKERSAGTISGGLGYGSFYGLSIQASVSHENFQGSGDRVSLSLNNSKAVQNYSFNYTQPYFTVDGVSLGYNVFFRETDYSELNINRSSQTSLGIGANVGIPLSEVSRFNIGGNFLKNTLNSYPYTASGGRSQQIIDLFSGFGLDPYVDTSLDFSLVELQTSWLRNTLNRGVFPDSGSLNQVTLEASVPGSDLEYYKLSYEFSNYWSITPGWSFKTAFKLSYGDGYGDGVSSSLPYFENFYGGSGDAMRGFENNTVGPREIIRTPTSSTVTGPDGTSYPIILPPENDTLQLTRYSSGGNAKASGTLELIFPTPFAEGNRSVRTSFFVDAGNVWNTKFDVDRYDGMMVTFPNGMTGLMPDYSNVDTYRVSAGFAIQWLSPMGPISISIGRPIRSQEFDEFEEFQFNIGRTF